jgi:MerR family Zn(II)-responsive transcriptional regulator of zntA
MFTISKVALQANVTTDSIRFYEREGLISPETKSDSGYRLYTDEAVRRIGFIKHAQQCGFSLSEIRELLELRGNNKSCCDDMYRVAIEKKLQLEAKIKALQAMSQALSSLITMCSNDKRSLDDCPILGALEKGLSDQRNGRPKAAIKRTRSAAGRRSS